MSCFGSIHIKNFGLPFIVDIVLFYQAKDMIFEVDFLLSVFCLCQIVIDKLVAVGKDLMNDLFDDFVHFLLVVLAK